MGIDFARQRASSPLEADPALHPASPLAVDPAHLFSPSAAANGEASASSSSMAASSMETPSLSAASLATVVVSEFWSSHGFDYQ